MVAPLLCSATVFSTAGGNCSLVIFFSCATATEKEANTITADAMVTLTCRFMMFSFRPKSFQYQHNLPLLVSVAWSICVLQFNRYPERNVGMAANPKKVTSS